MTNGSQVFPVCGFSGVVSRDSGKRLCKLNEPDRKFVTYETCAACPHAGKSGELFPICSPPKQQIRGVGDIIAAATSAVGIKPCGACKERQAAMNAALPFVPQPPALPPLTGPANLLWFVYPRRETSAIWLAQQEKIREAISQFDGLKLLAVAYDESTEQWDIDKQLFDDCVFLPNDPQARETNGWRWGMERMAQEPGFTVWLHAKGATRGTTEQHLVRWWTLGYDSLLDVPAVRASLDTYAITGTFRRHIKALGVPWHYAGAFYAVRNDAIRFPPSDAGGWYAEAWPGLIADVHAAGCLAFDGAPDLYVARNWK